MWPESGAAREGPAVFSLLQPRNVAGFRGTVRYASVNAHKNRVSGRAGPEEAGAAGPRSGAERAAGQEGRAGGRRGGERSTGRGRELARQRPWLEEGSAAVSPRPHLLPCVGGFPPVWSHHQCVWGEAAWTEVLTLGFCVSGGS